MLNSYNIDTCEKEIIMNRKIRRVFSIILVACMLLSLVPLHATSLTEEDSLSNELVDDELSINSNAEEMKTSDETESSLSSDNTEDVAEQQDILTMVDEETEETEKDNWELGLVFYDSSVDNGKTPLTEINWDASDGSYRDGTPRVITVQINYKNTNALTTYQPGELEISIPNLVYNTSANDEISPFWRNSVTVGANDSTHTGYDWNFVTASSPNDTQKDYLFTNANTIEEKSNFEGNIQIVYSITPNGESTRVSYHSNYNIEKYEDECVHNFNKELQAIFNKEHKTNKITLDYTRTYTHPWEKIKYTVQKTASKITSYDGLPEDANNYYWVKYSFKISMNVSISFYSDFPYIDASPRLIDDFPRDCIVLKSNFEKIDNNQYQYKSISSGGNCGFVFVGYPKSLYNDEMDTLNITNTAKIYGTYRNETKVSA